MNESALQNILESGLLGAMLVIALGVIAFLYRELSKEKQDRLDDLKEVWKGDLVFREQIKQTLENITELLRGK
jgi:preprotein translocase subunit YajC